MRAIRIDGQTPGGVRTPLVQVLPLDTPFIVQIFPVYGCNFKCNYCIHSVPVGKRNFISEKALMDFSVYKKCIDDLCEFPQKLKMLRFAGTGEPLLHKDIAKMVEYAAIKQVAASIDIVTNGALLTPELSRELINAGLSRIRVSIQGVDSFKYYQTTGAEFDFGKFVDNLTYFYQDRGRTKMYIKIIDCALDEDDEDKFLGIFGDICDHIAIEHLLPAVSQIDYAALAKDVQQGLTQNGVQVQPAEVCPQPFYLMQINPEGNVVPCCAMETACIMGNCREESLLSIWGGKKYDEFRQKQLLKQKDFYPVCKKCQQYKYSMFQEDILDNDADKLLKYYNRED